MPSREKAWDGNGYWALKQSWALPISENWKSFRIPPGWKCCYSGLFEKCSYPFEGNADRDCTYPFSLTSIFIVRKLHWDNILYCKRIRFYSSIRNQVAVISFDFTIPLGTSTFSNLLLLQSTPVSGRVLWSLNSAIRKLLFWDNPPSPIHQGRSARCQLCSR